MITTTKHNTMSTQEITMDIEMVASMGLDAEDYSRITDDWRHVGKGNTIPSKTYSDQPYIVKTDDGAWLCVMTTGNGREGEGGQHVISVRSTDCGKSWTDIVDVEPSGNIEASYAVLLKTPAGRIYCFYNHNTDNIREIIADKNAYPNGYCKRVDSLGYFVFKYSDDNGKSWSDKRYPIDVRQTDIDRQNPYQGKIKFFWNVGKPFAYGGAAFVSLHKVGSIGKGFFTKSEGFLLKSDNLLTETNPDKINWQTLPDGEKGLCSPPGGGAISEEQSYSVLSDGSFFCVYRTVDGYPACSYSRDGGYSWQKPEYLAYTHKGKRVKNPRAANFAWKCSNGKYLYWFHNHSGRDYEDRNPVWVCSGTEKSSPEGLIIEWSQPEILLYGDDPIVRFSYPDLIEENGDIYISETDKYLARTHKIDKRFLDKIFGYFDAQSICQEGLILDITRTAKNPAQVSIPKLPRFILRDLGSHNYGKLNTRNGISLDFCVNLTSLRPHQDLLNNSTPCGKGFAITTADKNNIKITLSDGISECCLSSEADVLKNNHLHHISIIIDSGPRVVALVVDGKFCDGGEYRQFGWGRFSPDLRDINGSEKLQIGNDVDGSVTAVRIYDRAIMTTEAVGNFRATLKNM